MNLKKSIILFLASFLFVATTWAQKPEKVYSFVTVDYPDGFYKEQVKAWSKVVDKEPNNADAWLNLYMANRYASYENENWEQRKERMDKVVEQLKENVPNTFEYHLVASKNDYQPGKDATHLLKAYEMAPNRYETYEPLLTHYLMKGDETQYRKFTKKLYESGTPSPGMLNYGYNMIIGLEENAIILTNGDNDTYPAWLMQVAENVRPDVHVINIHLLKIKSYRDRVFRELDVNWSIDLNSVEALESYKEELIKKMASNAKNYPVYAAITLSPEFTDPVEDNLYLTGLAFRYSTGQFDNIAYLKRNFEQRFALDYIETQFGYDKTSGIVKRMNRNYIVPMLNLYDHYQLSGDLEGSQRMKQLTLITSKGTVDEEKVKEYFKK